MGTPVSWLVLLGLILGIAAVVLWALRDARAAGRADVQRDVAEEVARSHREAIQAGAKARDEFEARRMALHEGKLDEPFTVDGEGPRLPADLPAGVRDDLPKV